MDKPRIIKSYEKLDDLLIDQVKLAYPYGFDKKLIQFKGIKGEFISALPFETEDHLYLIKMTRSEAQAIVEEDEDYDDDGFLTEDAQERIEEELDDDMDDYEED